MVSFAMLIGSREVFPWSHISVMHLRAKQSCGKVETSGVSPASCIPSVSPQPGSAVLPSPLQPLPVSPFPAHQYSLSCLFQTSFQADTFCAQKNPFLAICWLPVNPVDDQCKRTESKVNVTKHHPSLGSLSHGRAGWLDGLLACLPACISPVAQNQP